jgi:hypothetical protein
MKQFMDEEWEAKTTKDEGERGVLRQEIQKQQTISKKMSQIISEKDQVMEKLSKGKNETGKELNNLRVKDEL